MEYFSLTYQKSEQHIRNASIAREKAAIAAKIRKQHRIDEYNLSPTRCIVCSQAIPYAVRNTNKYCSRSCATKTNNAGRVRTEESKRKTASTIRGNLDAAGLTIDIIKSNRIERRKRYVGPIRNGICSICQCEFTYQSKAKRKTCSKTCQVHASVGCRSYRNGRRKIFFYYNKYQEKEVLLESSWELVVAKHLDDLNIRWVRPSYIKWIDSSNKQRLYYPDFELLDYNVFLDPKNPTALSLELEKMNAVERIINIKYGTIDSILEFIESLNNSNLEVVSQ